MLKKIYALMLVLKGYKYSYAKEYVKHRCRGNVKRNRQLKLVYRVLPLNERLDKLFSDVLSIKMALPEIKEYFPKYIALKVVHNGVVRYISLGENVSSDLYINIDDLLSKNARLLIRPCKNIYKEKVHKAEIYNNQYFFDNSKISREMLRGVLEKLPVGTVIMEDTETNRNIAAEFNIENPICHVAALNKIGEAANIVSIYITDFAGKCNRVIDINYIRFERAISIVKHVCLHYSELQYVNIALAITSEGFRIMQINTGEDLANLRNMPEEIKKFLIEKNKIKSRNLSNRGHMLVKYALSAYAKSKGFINYMYVNWRRGLKEDNGYAGTTCAEKLWAHKHGFYSYRIHQYGITRDNYNEFLSDYDYKRLRPLNNMFRKWFWDKTMSYHILQPCKDILPEYYCRSAMKASDIIFIPFEKNKWNKWYDAEGLVELLERTLKLAVKPSIGSHGKGFYKIEYRRSCGEYFINDKKRERSEICDFFATLSEGYIVSEYIRAHSSLQAIYPSVTPTIRVMTIRDGSERLIKDAYLRIGTAKTGSTDNIAFGGIAAKININTGKIENPELLNNHVFVPCKIHPDSGKVIKGEIPHWSMVKDVVKRIADYVAPLEYLGFDIVATETGVKILEINTHQDLHKYPGYSNDVKRYFAKKLKERKNHENNWLSD